MTIVVADNRPDLYLFWVVCLVFSVISAIHTCTYKYTIENRKIRYKWLFGKEKVIAFESSNGWDDTKVIENIYVKKIICT